MSTSPQSTDTDPTTTTTTTSTPSKTSTTSTYEYISSYDFASDTEFRHGLGTILGHPGTPASDTELLNDADDVIIQAKCFYISRKRNINPPINFTDYKSWLLGHGLIPSSSSSSDKAVASSSTALKSEATEPAYPTSFAHIVELITNNQPIPGIEEIPDTVLSGHDEPSKAARRRKPWEKDEVVDDS